MKRNVDSFVAAGAKSGWCGHFHKTPGGAAACIEKLVELGIAHDRIVFKLPAKAAATVMLEEGKTPRLALELTTVAPAVVSNKPSLTPPKAKEPKPEPEATPQQTAPGGMMTSRGSSGASGK